MPIREEQLERSMHEAAPRVSTVGVLDRVAQKRARRRTVHRVEVGALAAVLIVALSTVVVLARDDGQGTRVAARGGATGVRVITGGGAVTQGAGTAHAAVPIALDPDQGYVRGPLVVSGSRLALAAYDHDGDSFTYPPSRIVRLNTRTFREEGRTDLKAEILSITDDEGARWVVTRNPAPPNGLPDAFLKRIGADGGVTSTLLPPGTDPVGNVAAGAGTVWVPMRDGVVTYDPATGRLGRINLTPADSRDVVIANGAAWVTDGARVRQIPIDGSSAGGAQSPGDEAIGLALDSNGAPLPLIMNQVTGEARVGGQTLPRGFSATGIASTTGRIWVEGTVNGSPAVVLLGGKTGIRSTVVLDKGSDASFAWVSADTVLAVSNGTLLRIDLEK